jgi:hypothetical protein
MTKPTKLAIPSHAAGKIYQWLAQLVDPVWTLKGITGYAHFLADWRRYRAMPYAEPMRLGDAYPQVHDRVPTSPLTRTTSM